MAVIKSGATTDQWTIDPTSKAGRTTDYDPAGRSLASQSAATFSASGTFTPVATPTDLVTIYGSASKIVRVVSLKLTTTNTAAGSQQFLLIKRSSADLTGTFVAATAIPFDSNDTATATAIGHYTGNPGTLGTTVGTLCTARVASPAAVPASFAGVAQDAGFDLVQMIGGGASVLNKVVTLRGIAQGLVVNFAGAALVSGQTHAYNIVWTEEAL